ncbi:site-specific DNA-methyltransferase [Dokdonella soli]|uniref:Methyltransferase n=1 Tax=Dokdonella soli TaxID=529810 RepID=A0ABN1IE26_9GAMM
MKPLSARTRPRAITKPRVSTLQSTRARLSLAIAYRSPNELKPDPGNPRQHSAKQIDQIATSIETFGFNVPILIDDQSGVVAGHGRLSAAIRLGLTQVPTITLAHLTDAQRKAFLIADNRLTEISTWDEALLREQFLELSAADLDFDLTVTGFDLAEIDLAIQGLDPAPAGPDPDDALPALQPSVTRRGDLWLAGAHRVYCGDALDPASYGVLMPNECASVVFTDPPYNVKVSSISGKGRHQHREFAMASGEMNRREFTDFLRRACQLMVQHSGDGSIHFICMDFRHLRELLDAGESVYSELKNLCVWAKNNGGMGSLYRSRHELIFVFKAGTASHQNHVALGRFGRNRTNVWDYPTPHAIGGDADGEGDLLAEHPTPKPVAMIADALMDVSTRGDLVLDPFLGSGSTLIAAERVGRIARGIELDPRYVDLALRRWMRKAGRSPVHAALQLTFDEVRERREEGGHA